MIDHMCAGVRYLLHHYNANLRDAPTVISEIVVDICHMGASLRRLIILGESPILYIQLYFTITTW